MKRHVSLCCLVIVLAAAAAGTAAVCGSGTPMPPMSTPTAIPFVFTPVPYTYVPEGDVMALPLSLPAGTTADNCAPYVADEVGAIIEPGQLDAFTGWAKTYAFTVDVPPQALDLPVNVIVHVPLGSALDAVKLVQAHPGVVVASTDGFARYPESPPPPICPTRAHGT